MKHKRWIIICAILMGLIAVTADVANHSAVGRNNNQQTEKPESSQIPKDKYEYTLEEIEVKDNQNGWSKDEGSELDYADEVSKAEGNL